MYDVKLNPWISISVDQSIEVGFQRTEACDIEKGRYTIGEPFVILMKDQIQITVVLFFIHVLVLVPSTMHHVFPHQEAAVPGEMIIVVVL